MERNTDFVITIGDSVFNRTTCSIREFSIIARAPSAGRAGGPPYLVSRMMLNIEGTSLCRFATYYNFKICVSVRPSKLLDKSAGCASEIYIFFAASRHYTCKPM